MMGTGVSGLYKNTKGGQGAPTFNVASVSSVLTENLQVQDNGVYPSAQVGIRGENQVMFGLEVGSGGGQTCIGPSSELPCEIMFKQGDRVITLIERAGFPVGTIGIVVKVRANKLACDVELQGAFAMNSIISTYAFTELRKIEPIS